MEVIFGGVLWDFWVKGFEAWRSPDGEMAGWALREFERRYQRLEKGCELLGAVGGGGLDGGNYG